MGGPLSPLLFILVLENLSQAMIVAKRNKDYDDYKLGGTSSASHLIFADDVLFLHQSQSEIFNFFVKHPPKLLQSH